MPQLSPAQLRKIVIGGIAVILALFASVLLAACKFEPPSMWELKCAACHDGQTVLNDRVVPGREALRGKYPDMDAFTSACDGSPRCMNILKHDEKLFIDVGREIGIPPRNK